MPDEPKHPPLRDALGDRLSNADRSIHLDSRLPEPVLVVATRNELAYSISGLAIGGLALVGGIVLFYLGISGDANWSVNILGFQSKLVDASPGTILFVVGIIVILVTRFRVTMRR